MKMKLVNDKYFEGYVIFYRDESARLALEGYDGSLADKARYGTKTLNAKNLIEEDSDFIPSLYMYTRTKEDIYRPKPTPVWFIAYFKEGRENMLGGTRFLERKFGHLPKGNIKRYGKNILVKAENKIQAAMLSHFTSLQDDIISRIVPHPTFNTVKGVVYSRDLYEFTEVEILEMCPSTVYEVKKLSGRNGAILLHFSTRFIPDFIDVEHSRIRVKKYRYRPRQCYKCFEFGHVAHFCRSNPRCSSCSGDHEPMESCGPVKCLNCGECHPPTSRDCIRFKLEQDILEVAHNEFISIGSAKRPVLGASQSPESSYASVAKHMKSHSKNRNSLNHKPTQGNASRPYSPSSPCQANSSSQLSNLPSLDKTPIRTSSSKENLKDNYNPSPMKSRIPVNSSNNNSGNTGIRKSTKSDKDEKSKPSHSTRRKSKDHKSQSVESLMEETSSTGQKIQRDDSDLEEFNLPYKKHRSHKSPPKNREHPVDTNNSFSPLSELDADGGQKHHNSRAKPKTSMNDNEKEAKMNKHEKVIPKIDQSGAKIQLQRNSISQAASSSKDEPKMHCKKKQNS